MINDPVGHRRDRRKSHHNGVGPFPTGGKVPRHSDDCDERLTILEGEAEAEVDGQRRRLHSFDTRFDKPRRFVNVGISHLTIIR